MRRHIERAGRGTFRLRLSEQERDVLRRLPRQLRSLLDRRDPSVWRLFPPAYDEEESEAEYRRLMGEELVAAKHEALRIVEETIDAKRLDEDQLAAWLGAINDLRLVFGTRLGVTEELDEEEMLQGPDGATYSVYLFLGWLEEQAVAALSG
ncbi:MAG TPA: DUF2017 family protein [Actinomycetota bacterium]|nr:DUF2017 family protein [Actinomycetota bacterium]